MGDRVQVVIADDEPLARRALRSHLAAVDWIGDIHETGDGLSAIRVVDTIRPGLLFLDIMMPGASGIAVAGQIVHRPHIVFTTAFDRYAVTAFEIGALDYLLKPFGRERVMKVLGRARSAIEHGLPSIMARASQALEPCRPIAHLFVKERGRILRVAVDTVQRLEACDDYVAIHCEGGRYLMNVRLRELHARLDPAKFVRVHRSHVVNLAWVTSLDTTEAPRLTVVMADGTLVRGSREGSLRLRQLGAGSSKR